MTGGDDDTGGGGRCGGWLRGGPAAVLVGGVFGYFAMASGQSTVFAVMKVPTRDGCRLSEVAMSTYFSLSQLLSSLLLPFAGAAVDRYGIRRTALCTVAALAAACLAMATLVSGGFSVFLGLFFIRLFSKSAELPFKTQVNYHWQHARGRAMAVVSLFGGEANPLCPPPPPSTPRSTPAAGCAVCRM